MKRLFHNPETARRLFLSLVATAAAVTAGFLRDPFAGVLAGICCVFFIVVGAVADARRYEKLSRFADDIDRILHGDEKVKLDSYGEGDIAVLECEISKMTVRLREQSEALIKDKAELADFMADVSHQLRTPLTSLNLVASLLARPDCTEAKRAELLRETSGLLRRIDWLLTALLKLSRLDAGAVRFVPETVPMEDFLRKACEPVRIPVELRDQTLETKASGNFTGDVAWTAEAVGNIVKNCMEHTPEGGTITVEGSENALYVEIKASDTGPGVAEEDLPRIFDRFYKGKDSGDEGFGVGLALAKKIAVNQEGSLTVSNRPSGGAEFVMRLYRSNV